jgi:hypothetical protein
MEENKGSISDRTELAKHLSEMGRNTPRVSFKISYTGTPGNLKIDKSFQEFCHYYANNEYLAGVGLLLEVFYHYKQLSEVHERIDILNAKLEELQDSLRNTPKEKKTF